VYLVDDVDLVAAAGGHHPDIVPNIADVIHAVVGCPVNLNNINVVARADGNAVIALIAWAYRGRIAAGTVEGLGENAGRGGLADAPGTDKQEGMMNTPALYGIGQGPGDMVLSHHFVKGLGTPFSCYRHVLGSGHYVPLPETPVFMKV